MGLGTSCLAVRRSLEVLLLEVLNNGKHMVRSMRDGRCRELSHSSEARCKEVTLYNYNG